MVITANSGPYLGFGITMSSTGQVMQYNEERAPSTFDLGQGIADPRPAYSYTPGSAVGSKVTILWDNAAYVDYVPATANSSNIAQAASNAPASGAALTLSAAGSSVGAISTTISAPEGGTTSTIIALDSTAAYVSYGQAGTIAAWNPQAGTGRTILITTSSSGDGGSVTVAGRDMYGYKMTETVVLSTATTTLASSNAAGYKWPTKKAFKYVSSVTASTTVTSTGWSVGMQDTFGFPAKLAYCGINSAVQLLATAYSSAVSVAMSSATVVLASTVATQASSTPDVRGTYASTTASNGTLRVQMYQGFDGYAMSQITATDQSAIFGAAQYSSV